MTHREFLAVLVGKAHVFHVACKLAGIKPTTRQVSKWRRGKGLARTFETQAREEIESA